MISEQEALKLFNDFLDEIYPVYEIAGGSFNPNYILKELDPDLYDEAFSNWIDSSDLKVEGYTEEEEEEEEE